MLKKTKQKEEKYKNKNKWERKRTRRNRGNFDIIGMKNIDFILTETT